MRRIAVALLSVVTLILVGFASWDLLKFGRQVPPLAAHEGQATSIVVDKQKRRLTVFRYATALKTYEISLGGNPVGPKQREGDSRTPEGNYSIDSKNARSRFHLALHISYPDAADEARAAQNGVSAGSDIMIHGLPNGLGWLGRVHLLRDWTDGCVAVTNTEIEEIWAMVGTGTRVIIQP
jgi:murein L,D-transpeptidase YafK